MKKLVMVFLFLLVIGFIFVSCASKGGIDIVIIQNDPTVVQDGSILTPNTMAKFAWTDINGHSVKCDFILEKNGEKLEERRGEALPSL